MCEIGTKFCVAFAAFLAFFASYQSIRVTRSHPDKDDDDNPKVAAKPFFATSPSPPFSPQPMVIFDKMRRQSPTTKWKNQNKC